MEDTFDLVVVGAGTAGIACSIEAAAAGARVFLVDKADEIGGTLHVSGGQLSAAGTRRQRARGIVDDPDAHFADVMRISRGSARPDLVRQAVDLAASTVDWLDDHGFVQSDESPAVIYGHEPYGRPRTHFSDDQGMAILAVLAGLLEPCVARGAVELRLSTPVTGLVRDGGAVTGVQLDGGARIARAGATVLATGGLGSNPELFARLERAPLVSAAWPTSTGDGLLLAEAAGAAVAGAGCYLPTFGGLPPATGTGRVDWSERPELDVTRRLPVEIYVDRAGRRFVAEDHPSIDHKERALAGLDGMTFFLVIDARTALESNPMPQWGRDGLALAAGRRTGVVSADTIRVLAEKAGIDPRGLEKTVVRYNAAVAAGRDEDFGRRHLPFPIAEPPFYALENHGLTLITFSGADVDSHLGVRRPDGTTIDGLYAAGELLGAAATSGNSFCGGMLVTPSLSFGRLLGRRLALAAAARPSTTGRRASSA